MKADAVQDRAIQATESNQQATQSATKRQPSQRGVRAFNVPGKRSPFAVQWRIDGKRKTEFFAAKGDRDLRAGALRKEKQANMLPLVPTRADSQEWAAFKIAIGEADWRDVVAAWKTAGGAAAVFSVNEAVERYLADQDKRLADGRLAQVTHKKNCPKAKAFAADFTGVPVMRVTGEEIEEWIEDLGFEAAETFNTYRKVIHAVFESCRKVCPLNPAADVPLRNDKGEVGILTVDQTVTLLAYAQNHFPEIVARLSLECFAGLRFSSAYRLERGDINFEDKGVLLPAHKLKTGMQTGRRHYIDGLPENLFDWVMLENAATWTLSPREYRRLKSKCFNDARVPHPHNGLRHSFCTYHVAAFKNPGLTATILAHRNQGLLWSTYNGKATQKEGLRYFTLRPQ
jgi:integrase